MIALVLARSRIELVGAPTPKTSVNLPIPQVAAAVSLKLSLWGSSARSS
ncbi:MAG: hypothetical protein R2880_05020 [Deinococcales bacterium]